MLAEIHETFTSITMLSNYFGSVPVLIAIMYYYLQIVKMFLIIILNNKLISEPVVCELFP